METLKQAGQFISSKTEGHAHEASKEANKSVAKDGNAGISTRLHAAKDAVGDAMNEHSAKNEAELHKQAAKH